MMVSLSFALAAPIPWAGAASATTRSATNNGRACEATLIKAHHHGVLARTRGDCSGDHLVIYLASDSSYDSQTLVRSTRGHRVDKPCGYWQADFIDGPVAASIEHPRTSPSLGHHVLAWMRGHRIHDCT
jgi:hypothetical protein